MASMIVSKRAPLISMLVEKLRVSALRPAAASAAAARSFSTNQPSEEKSLDINRRRSSAAAPVRRRGGDLFPSPFSSDVWDPFNVGTNLSQMMNMMEQMLEGSPSTRLGWDAWEDGKALHLTMEMPGLSKEDVKVWMEGNTLVIKGESKGQEDEEEGGGKGEGEGGGEAARSGRMRRRYSSKVELPSKGYKMAEIKAEVKNGVLKVLVPKAPSEERDDVIHVQVQ